MYVTKNFYRLAISMTELWLCTYIVTSLHINWDEPGKASLKCYIDSKLVHSICMMYRQTYACTNVRYLIFSMLIANFIRFKHHNVSHMLFYAMHADMQATLISESPGTTNFRRENDRKYWHQWEEWLCRGESKKSSIEY